MYSRFINWFSATRAGSWMVKHVASRFDPILFRATNGRFTLTGIPTLPMLTLTTIGRKTGTPRYIQLAYCRDGDDLLVVASAMGQERHPAWRYNLEAHTEGEAQMRGERFMVRATVLSDADKARVWPLVAQTIPQMKVYEQRTQRNIRVFRLTRVQQR